MLQAKIKLSARVQFFIKRLIGGLKTHQEPARAGIIQAAQARDTHLPETDKNQHGKLLFNLLHNIHQLIQGIAAAFSGLKDQRFKTEFVNRLGHRCQYLPGAQTITFNTAGSRNSAVSAIPGANIGYLQYSVHTTRIIMVFLPEKISRPAH